MAPTTKSKKPARKRTRATRRRRGNGRPRTQTAGRKAQPPRGRTLAPGRPQRRQQFTVHLRNKPGEMAKLTRLLQKEGVNIAGLSVSELADTSAVRFVPEDATAARRALDAAAQHYALRDVLLVESDNVPGVLAHIGAVLGKRKINIDYVYATAVPEERHALIVLAVDDVRAATVALRA